MCSYFCSFESSSSAPLRIRHPHQHRPLPRQMRSHTQGGCLGLVMERWEAFCVSGTHLARSLVAHSYHLSRKRTSCCFSCSAVVNPPPPWYLQSDSLQYLWYLPSRRDRLLGCLCFRVWRGRRGIYFLCFYDTLSSSPSWLVSSSEIRFPPKDQLSCLWSYQLSDNWRCCRQLFIRQHQPSSSDDWQL